MLSCRIVIVYHISNRQDGTTRLLITQRRLISRDDDGIRHLHHSYTIPTEFSETNADLQIYATAYLMLETTTNIFEEQQKSSCLQSTKYMNERYC